MENNQDIELLPDQSKEMTEPSSASSDQDMTPPAASDNKLTPTAPDQAPSKRQILSCISCRTRKVKCDRVHPCQACCARGTPKSCKFDLKDAEDFEAIQQAYEIRKLRVENERLKRTVDRLKSGREIKKQADETDADSPSYSPREAPQVPPKPFNLQQRRFQGDAPSENLYFGSPGLASVVAEFAQMQINVASPASVAHNLPRGVDIFAFQDAPLYPFPALWRADRGTSALLACLPPEDDLYSYLESFQTRAQSCSFPHVPEEITRKEIERFLSDRETNAEKHPDMLALVFAAIAQGLQNGVYDKSGGEWVDGAMEAEAWKGDLYIAASMQALRLASFTNRPSLLGIQTLIMICPYLTNGGKFLDAWALLGLTIRLAQSIGLHRNPLFLDPAPPLKECSIRQALWWWMLHMDQQYSMTLGRPLGISGIGDCPAPEPLTTNATVLRLSEYINRFSILGRRILSSDSLTTQKVDAFTDELLALRETLPDVVQFDDSWNDQGKKLPDWPLDAQAAVFYGKTHNYLILLNRQRIESDAMLEPASRSPSSATGSVSPGATDTPAVTLRGRARVLESARALLAAFQFFATRCRAAMLCWTMGQQAFNSAMILTLSLLNPHNNLDKAVQDKDYVLVHRAYGTFAEMHLKGIHKLAGVAAAKLAELLIQLHDPVAEEASDGPFAASLEEMGRNRVNSQDTGNLTDSQGDLVMGNTGMILLEDPGLQAFISSPSAFSPLTFHMAGGELPPEHSLLKQRLQQEQKQENTPRTFHHHYFNGDAQNQPCTSSQAASLGSPGWTAKPAPASHQSYSFGTGAPTNSDLARMGFPGPKVPLGAASSLGSGSARRARPSSHAVEKPAGPSSLPKKPIEWQVVSTSSA